jgi:tetraacyldisaccharide 4'-kinase
MIQNVLAKILLYPFTLLYGAVIRSRNLMYEAGLLKATSFNLPIISVGNLSIGGAGKTPHIEYLIRLLSPYITIGTLSRGYKRKTKGFRFVENKDTALISGDEPLQYRRKYQDIVVAVSESRTLAIPLMVKHVPNLQLILLDDAFQHRAIIPGLSILLTTFDHPFTDDILLPAGRLREYPDAYKRADIIIVSKCPDVVSEGEREHLVNKICPLKRQQVFFTRYSYGHPYSFADPRRRISLSDNLDVIMVSAIANTAYMMSYLEQKVDSIHTLEYEDHHIFTERDIEYISQVYANRDTEQKIILTTEKDAMRLDLHRASILKNGLPIYILPAEVSFLFNEDKAFNALIQSFLLNFKV